MVYKLILTLLFIVITLSALHNVSKGEHFQTVKPKLQAIAAVIYAVLAMGIWLWI